MTSVNLNYMFGNLIGRAIVISLFAYILWYIYNMNMNMVPVVYNQEQRRFGRTSGYNRYSRYGRIGRR